MAAIQAEDLRQSLQQNQRNQQLPAQAHRENNSGANDENAFAEVNEREDADDLDNDSEQRVPDGNDAQSDSDEDEEEEEEEEEESDSQEEGGANQNQSNQVSYTREGLFEFKNHIN